ncbi:MAG: multidrug ABC transporter ATP-binding protein [Anaerolineae bacterium]|nr:MAG: multidrug ABC transporter ATP-binding protein [Anaerolineae bacterium]
MSERRSAQANPDFRLRMSRGPMAVSRIEKARHPRHAIRRLLPYFGGHGWLLMGVVLLVLIYTLCGLTAPILIGKTIDEVIQTRSLHNLPRWALLMLGVFLVGNLAEAASGWLMAAISQRALQKLRRDLFEHLQTLPISFFDSHTVGEVMSRLTNDVDAINQAVSQNLVSLLASTLSLGGILIAMFVLNLWLALAAVVVVPLMFWFTDFIARYTRKGFRELQSSLGKLNGVMEEAISGLRVVKAFRRNESVLQNFRQENQAVYRAAVAANSYALLLMPLTNQLGNLFVIAIAGLGGWLALHQLVSVGMIATFISYARNFINPLRQLANLYNAIQAALAGAERVFEVIDIPSEETQSNGNLRVSEVRGEVTFRNVSFGYHPQKRVIKNFSLEAKAGQTIALVGPTGAGKTTLVNLLSRFYEVDEGCICLDGRDLRQIPKPELRRLLGIVLQDTFLFSTTVMENIRYGRLDASDDEVIQAAILAEADPFIRRLPHGYQTLLSERASNLSQGQRQMIAIARAILADPAILILDEATSSVDTRTEARIQKALLRLMQGRTSFVIAHRLRTIRDADVVVVIRDGEIVEMGKHQELLSRQGFYHHLYLSQFKGEAI